MAVAIAMIMATHSDRREVWAAAAVSVCWLQCWLTADKNLFMKRRPVASGPWRWPMVTTCNLRGDCIAHSAHWTRWSIRCTHCLRDSYWNSPCTSIPIFYGNWPLPFPGIREWKKAGNPRHPEITINNLVSSNLFFHTFSSLRKTAFAFPIPVWMSFSLPRVFRTMLPSQCLRMWRDYIILIIYFKTNQYGR